jgi:hypothetical protein
MQAPLGSSPLPQSPSPHEDPDLVGHAAAERARAQRLYREMILRGGDEALEYEGAGWDFIIRQMSDWDERERSWNAFRADRENRSVWGLGGLGPGAGSGVARKFLGRLRA